MIEQKQRRVSTFNLLIRYMYLMVTFLISDAWLRVVTRWISRYSIYAFAPNCFTVCWSLLLTLVVATIRPRKVARIVYGFFFLLSSLYAFVQYFAYQILGRFLYISDFLYASEGGDYKSYVLSFLDWKAIFYLVAMIVIGIVGIRLIPDQKKEVWKSLRLVRVILAAVSICGIIFAPLTYEKSVTYNGLELTNNFSVPSFEYEKFVNSDYDMELTGTYQFVARDEYLSVSKKFKSYEKEYSEINQYFSQKEEHVANDMTGVFKEKNLVVVLMESMDDWLIDEETTPTIRYMMDHGINLANLYTPKYSSGYTFNTEFAFNTSVYPFSNGNAAYALARNTFSKSLASIFSQNGYTCNSFHEGYETFYNRGVMHKAFGYNQYHSFYDYEDIEGVLREDDTYLPQSEELMSDLTDGRFMSFVITLTPHLPYDEKDGLNQYIVQRYPEYFHDDYSEVGFLKAKASVTDEMFRQLLQYLKDHNLKDDTVIAAFTDHYSYGLSDQERLKQLSEEAGSTILEKTPAFIYCSDWDTPIKVDKTVQITDLAPTLENLFGFEVPVEIMGNDIFDSDYSGIAIFSGDRWLTDDVYVSDGNVVWNHGMDSSQVNLVNDYVRRSCEINDYILNSDYYSRSR